VPARQVFAIEYGTPLAACAFCSGARRAYVKPRRHCVCAASPRLATPHVAVDCWLMAPANARTPRPAMRRIFFFFPGAMCVARPASRLESAWRAGRRYFSLHEAYLQSVLAGELLFR